ncbi:interferon-inducible GTPase 5-like [Emydura macquarii macquarii]|uniref:interferon-inducible GTPase 5-like n=1 Tax=Emydura macquarii macquarii TaxID=1129001 RepID=UPI00352B64F8
MAEFTSISDDLYEEDRNTLLAMSVEQTKQIEASIKAGKFLEAASGVQKLTDLSDIEFSIAIAGESGSGKSSFINAIRGLGDEDKDAAETGVMEVTKEPVQYCHLMYPMVFFSDLPGIDTPDFQPNAYLKQVKFRHYDVFIIIASERFRANHIKLAQELQRMGKKFYFVRSKVDLDLYNEKHKKSFNEERILEKIRNNCVSNLSREGMSSPQVFLVSSREFQKYDSPKLQKTLLKELYSHKIRATEAPGDRGGPGYWCMSVSPVLFLWNTVIWSPEGVNSPWGESSLILIGIYVFFPRMTEDSKAHWADLFSKWGRRLPGLSKEESEEFQTAVKAGNLSKAISVVKKSDELLRNTKLNIAITGDTGTGKSSFINAVRSLNDKDDGAAQTGLTETTKKPTHYPHPMHPNVILWDLPGIGTLNYPAKTYRKDVNLDRYDFFIIISAQRFTEADAHLAKEINSMGKKFYFVRSKVDVDLANEQREGNFNEEETLQVIRNDCKDQLRKAGITSPQVFLVSRWHFDKYDSPQLQETLANDLDTHKRHVFICALPSTSEEILKEKQKALQEQIWKQALKSCAIAAVPLPFLSVYCDVSILVDNMTEYCKSFGLDDGSLASLAKQVRKSVLELKSVIKSPLAKDISRDEALKRLREATGKRMMTAKYFLSVVPLLGTGIAAERSYNVTYEMLHTFLDEVAEDAQRVLRKALEGAEKN